MPIFLLPQLVIIKLNLSYMFAVNYCHIRQTQDAARVQGTHN